MVEPDARPTLGRARRLPVKVPGGGLAMLKIVIGRTSGAVAMLHLEGQIVGPWVAELAGVCEPILAGGAALDLDLASVSFVSHEGVDLLRRLGARRARLLNCSRFVTEQLRGADGTSPIAAPAPGGEGAP